MAENRRSKLTAESVFNEHSKGKSFNDQINLDNTVEVNENFFIGKQWEGVQSNGLPTPVFNFLKRVVLFQVSSILSDNLKIQASPLAVATDRKIMEWAAQIVSNEYEALFEHNKIASLLREYMRNAAVDGDGCLYTYWDSEVETGQAVKGAIVTEVIENTRVFFGNPNERRVQKQPYIIIESREMLDSVKDRAKENGVKDLDLILSDTDDKNTPSRLTDNRVTVLLRMWREKDGKIWACECVKNVMIREPWDMGIRLYPITWLNWDYVQDCYHGQAMITGLIPNQIFVNKTYAMVQLSLMQSAFPKIVYDKTRISKWTNQTGVAIGVQGGDVNQVAKILEPAQVSPQIAQFIDSTINYTQMFLGATDAALGQARPDNTSAILALQRAANTPQEMTKQNCYQSVEDLGNIYMEFMIANYGVRTVIAPPIDVETPFPMQVGGVQIQTPPTGTMEFDFSSLSDIPMKLKLDIGASSYWSEIASMQTLDNLLMQNKIGLIDYLERVPSGYISKKQELIDDLKNRERQMVSQQSLPPNEENISPINNAPPEIQGGGGYRTLQRIVNENPVA